LLIAGLGIFLSHRFANPYLDGVASMGVGLVLATVAILLARESKGLLVGEGASPQVLATITRVAREDRAVVAVRRPVTIYFGPQNALLAMDVEFRADLSTADIASAVDRLEERIRQDEPDVKHIYIEAEALRQAAAAQPSPRPRDHNSSE
jgi:divalent metal cation (Fe/Co/Zn/Cd) transporter